MAWRSGGENGRCMCGWRAAWVAGRGRSQAARCWPREHVGGALVAPRAAPLTTRAPRSAAGVQAAREGRHGMRHGSGKGGSARLSVPLTASSCEVACLASWASASPAPAPAHGGTLVAKTGPPTARGLRRPRPCPPRKACWRRRGKGTSQWPAWRCPGRCPKGTGVSFA